MNKDITYFATTNWRNEKKRFGIKQGDRLMHMYVLGTTGAGKSTLLKNLVRQDIEAGRGVCLLDPHGDLINQVFAFVPTQRQQDVIFFNLPDPSMNLRYNPFKRVTYEKRSLVASGIIDVFKKLWSDAWGVKLEHILRHAVLTLLDQPAANLSDIRRLLLEKSYRTEAIKNVENESVREFWQKEFGVYKWYDFLPVLNKIGGMLAHPVIKRVLVENTQEVFLRKAMDEGKIILMNLSKGHLGEDAAHLLGSLFISSLSAAAFSRADTIEIERMPFMIYMDEFHNYSTLSTVGMLSELRKFKVGLILAHQYLAQLLPEIRTAVLGNIGTIIAFRLGADDAYHMSKEFSDILPESFISQANFCIYLKLMIDGVPSKPFSAVTSG